MSSSKSLRPYRAIFILDTRELQESVDALVRKIKEAIANLKGEVVACENLGMHTFARATDRKFPSGHYLQVDFEGAGELPAALKERFRLDRFVNRIFIENR